MVDNDSPMMIVLSFIYEKYKDRYKDYTIRNYIKKCMIFIKKEMCLYYRRDYF